MMPESQKLPTAAQIDAAQRLYEKTEYWRLEDTILTELREKDPGLTDQQLTLIKATLVNSFYNAGCSQGIENLTSWIVAQKPELPEQCRNIGSNDDKRIKLVQDIAFYGRPVDNTDGCIVFASKFAHFFLDANIFPIYDQYARMLVHFHIDTLKEGEQPGSKYGIFYKKFFQLKQQLEQRYSVKKLDCYLWLAGQYVAWKKGIRKPFYIASRVPFDDPGNQPLFETLFPPAMIEDVPDDLLLRELELTANQKKALESNGTQT